MAPNDPLRVLFFGTFDERAHPRTAALRDSFAEAGDDIRSINEPLQFNTAARVDAVSKPWRLAAPAAQLARCWWRLTKQARGLGSWRPDVVVVGYLGQFDVLLARLLFPRHVIVLDMMVGLADTIESRGLRKGAVGEVVFRLVELADRVAQRTASMTMFDTAEHAELLSRRQADVVVPVGATKEWWAAGQSSDLERASDGSLKVIFFGTYSALQGAPTIGEAIHQLRDHSNIAFTMVGDGQERLETERRAGDSTQVTWHDWLTPAELVQEVASHDVCLGIFASTPRSGRIIPNKVYQGVAAGCHVITASTPGQVRQLGSAVEFVPPENPTALAEAIVRAANERPDHRRSERLEWAQPRSLALPLRKALLARSRQPHFETGAPATGEGDPRGCS